MKPLHVFRWFMSAAIAALLPATIQTTAAHGMGGGHGGMRMAPNFSSGRGFGHFDHRRDFAFRHHGGDRFFFAHDIIAFSFAIKIDSSLVLISLRLASLGGTPIPTRTPIPTTTVTPTVIPLMTTDQVTITSIGPLWPCQCSRNLPGVAITMALLTG